MPINLTVILGAGAAFDVVNFQSNQQVDDANFRPPTTANLFQTHKDWESEYMKFPSVASVIEELRNTFPSKDPTSLDIENFLKALKESPKPHRNAQFREFPLYLQHYFTAVTEKYCKKPSNYMTLINKIFDLDLGKVVFVTTNYELLFDKALHHQLITEFSINDPNMNKYISSENWAYIKLHGSIDWGRRIKESMVKNKSNTLPGLVDNVAQLGKELESTLESDIIRDHTFNLKERQLIYPAISVPVGESKLNCPDDHVLILKDHLNNCHHFLIIGFSGYDVDILKFLDEKESGFGKVLFVSGSEDSAREANGRFFSFGDLGNKLQGHADIYPGNGFDEFVRTAGTHGLDGYLKNLF